MVPFTAPSLQALCDGKQSGGEYAAAPTEGCSCILYTILYMHKCFSKFTIRFSYKSVILCH